MRNPSLTCKGGHGLDKSGLGAIFHPTRLSRVWRYKIRWPSTQRVGSGIGLNRSITVGNQVFPNLKGKKKKKQPKNQILIANIITKSEQIPKYEQISKTAKHNFKSLPNQSHKFPNMNKFPKQKKTIPNIYQIKATNSQIKTYQKGKIYIYIYMNKNHNKFPNQLEWKVKCLELSIWKSRRAAAWVLLWIGEWWLQLRVRDLREWGRRWYRSVRSDRFKTRPKTPHELWSPPLANCSCHCPQPWWSDLHLLLLIPNDLKEREKERK